MNFSRWPALRGGALALAAAVLFGISTPLVQGAGRGLGPLATAALLYAGAAAVGLFTRQPAQQEARLAWADAPRLLAMAVLGAGLGPVALAWGLQQTGGTSASLLLTLEALFTALLARLLYGEMLGRKVWAALALLTAGAAVLVAGAAVGGQSSGGAAPLAGMLAVVVATLAWAADNSLSRALADRDPAQVVLAKALLGATLTAGLATALREPPPAWPQALALLAIGATGYGLSLRFYLLAQRAFGAARTGSVFAFAPFIGAAVAVALGERGLGWPAALGGLLMLAGVALHLAESHDHPHQHSPLEHDHAHRHDDGHHDHTHEPAQNFEPGQPHSHPHRHKALTHAHAHVPDLHHAHPHPH